MDKDTREFYISKLTAHFMSKWGIEEGLAQGLAFIAIEMSDEQVNKILEE
tara:strand:+ start:240 stop:389 length:150 start_codon:yes stop_codon:yes gene_type:complete